MPTRTANRPSCAERVETLFRDELTDFTKAAGFRRKRLVYTRVREGILQIIQVHVSVTVSGGASLDEGFFRIQIACGPEQISLEEGCPYSFEIHEAVPSTHSWRVPPTRGPKRDAVVADLVPTFTRLIAALDTLTSDARAKEFAAQALERSIARRAER